MTKKLLIVDDEADIRECAARYFKKRGLDVLVAESGEEALEITESQKPDLILLDVAMEGMSGFQAASAIRDSGNKVKIIFVTGSLEDDVSKEAEGLDVQGVVRKPLHLPDLENLEQFGDAFARHVQRPGRGEAGVVRVSVHEFFHPESFKDAVLWLCRCP